MKKALITAASLLFVMVAMAQETSPQGKPPGQPPPPPSLEERLKKTNEMLQKEIKPNDMQQKALEDAFREFFVATDQVRKDNPPPPPPPPNPKVKEAMDKLVKERDDKIRKVLTDEQFKKFKEAEKTKHPHPPPPPPAQN